MDILEVMQYPWALRALLAACMVGILCGALGVFIVLRNMALIGDALAHAILPGIVVAFILVGYSTFAFFIGAVAAGIVTAVIITWIQHSSNTKNDAAIGIVFTAMFALGVIGISRISRNEGVHLDLKDFLFGNILGVSDQDLWLTAAVTIVTIVALLIFYRPLFASTFQATIAKTMGISVQAIHYFLMLLLSFAVVASLRTVGVILVVAMLITPAATALLLVKRLPLVLILSSFIGLVTAIVGFIFSIWLETTPGPAMTVSATMFYLIALVFAPEKGLLAKALRRRALKRRIMSEDILKKAMRPGHSVNEWLGELNMPALTMRSYIQLLQRKGLIEMQNGQWELTDSGREKANEIIRAHRLWETYLVNKAGMEEQQIHDDAERQEHWLPEDVLDEMEEVLGFPDKDPHGSPIPPKSGSEYTSLWKIPVHENFLLSEKACLRYQEETGQALGLQEGKPVTVINKDQDQVTIRQYEKTTSITKSLAEMMRGRPDHSSSEEPI